MLLFLIDCNPTKYVNHLNSAKQFRLSFYAKFTTFALLHHAQTGAERHHDEIVMIASHFSSRAT